ncbi:MAG: GNAT family N-acetyltransferase [Anaerolineales bacterium]|nr:GNAT family N-acetyltransferase [Anaerolineales bacterium]
MAEIPGFCPRCGHKLIKEEQAGRSRSVCPDCHYVVYQNPVPGVGILCEMENGLLLIQRGHPPFKGHWTLPSGYIEADESSEQAAIRECKEETGLDIELLELFGVGSFPEGSLRSGIVIFYRARPAGGRLKAGDDAIDARVFSIDNLPEIPFRTHREVITRWVQAQRQVGDEPITGASIRPATFNDEERILALMESIPDNSDHGPLDREKAQRRFREKLGFDVFVAQHGKEIVGYLVLSFIPALGGLRAWIDDVVVDSTYQRQGLGASLVEAAIQTASRRGATHLFVYAARGDTGAREFYRACGFDQDGVAPLRIR